VPNYLIEYRLRIRNASTSGSPNGTADALVLTSIAGGTNPYLAGPPSGDGQELDPVTGAVRTGAYVVEVVDVATSVDGTGTVRVLTNNLEDTAYRQQFLSRRAYLETRTDGGAWQSLIAGYVLGIRLVSPVRYAITVGDTRRVDVTQPVAVSGSIGTYDTRGCLLGGPVTADFGPVKARGGWEYEVTGITGRVVSLAFRRGYAPNAQSPEVTDFSKLYRDDVVAAINSLGSAFAPEPVGALGGGRVVLDLTLFIGTTRTNAVATNVQLAAPGWFGPNLDSYGLAALTVYWPTTAPVALPSSGDRLYLSMAQTTVSPVAPLLIDAHPVNIALAVWDDAGIDYDSSGAWIDAVRNLIGADVRIALRLTETPTIDEFLRNTIYGPFGLTTRTDSLGRQELVPSRIRVTTTPSLTIAAGDLRDQSPVVFEIDERSAVQSVSVTMQALGEYLAAPDTSSSPIPPDGIAVTTLTQRMTNASGTVFGARDIAYDIPGMVHNAASFLPSITEFLQTIGQETIDRFGYGAPSAEVAVLASAASAAAQVGEEVYLEAPHYPNRNYRIGESTIGARIMQVIRRTETPAGPVFRLLDSGINAQPVSPAATISIAASSTLPLSVARFTITNAATINSGGVLGVEVEWGVGASAPTGNGQTFIVYAAGAVPTGAVDLPAVTGSAQTVHVRARTLQSGRRPSAWTAWASVTLTAIPTPGTPTATVTDTSAQLQWSNSSSAYPIAVHLYLGGSAPANWAPYRIATVPAGTTVAVVRSLSAGLTYQVGLAYDTPSGLGPFATASITASGSLATATRPAGLALITQTDDLSLPQGIALGLFASDPTKDLIIERSPVSGTGFAELARVSGGSATYADLLPRNATTYYYRLKHALGGFTTSSATGEVSGQARGIPQPLVRPGAVVPTVGVAVTETSTQGTVTLSIVDPQGRLTQVRFREDTGSGFGAWTVVSAAPYTYTGTIPTTGFLKIEYEVSAFDADDRDRVIAGGVESFDRNRIANIVSAAGTFDLAGGLTIAVQADTDTASFRWAAATTPWASDAAAYTAAQAGTLVNARNGTISLAGPYAVGSTVYLAIAAYDGASGAGNVSGPYRYSYVNGSRDTISLTARARITATTATDVTVRVAVACPVAPSPNTAGITYSATGITFGSPPPTNPQSVTPELSDSTSEAVGSFVDYTVPRPAVGNPPGRITFTVTAASRVAAVDAVDVIAQDIVGPSLSIVTTPGTSSYSLAVTYVGTPEYYLDNVSQSVSGWSSPQTVTVTRNDFTGAAKVASFKVTKDGSAIGESVTVPAKDATSATITIGQQNADDVTNEYEFTWTGSGFPTGTVYDLQYRTVTTTGDVEDGFLTNQTSPVTVTSGYTIGINPTYQMTVFARLSDTVLMSRFRAGTFLT
jgi:hypothetical protein